MTAILYYISGHGYGHAVRSAQVIRALSKTRSGLKIHVRTTAPEWLFPRSVVYSRQSLDVGLIQRDSLRMDLEATLHACERLYGDAEQLIQQEIAFIRAHTISLIAADIPPLAFEIAARADVPAIAITNFSWDDIYQAYSGMDPNFGKIAAQISGYHNKATLLLELPYACPMQAFPVHEPIPWIARPVRLTKAAAREKFGLPQNPRIVMLSFGGFGLTEFPWEKLNSVPELFFVATADVKRAAGNIMFLPDTQRHYEDLLRAVDLIVTKPGYGIVADVLSQQVPILYTDRGEFPEYEYLVRALTECATAEYIPQTELLAGNIGPDLSRLFNKPPNWPAVSLNGAEVAAEKIAALVS